MPALAIAQNGSWVNYTYSNCSYIATNGIIVYNSVPISSMNLPGVMCTIQQNFPWWGAMFVIIIYVIGFILFMQLRSGRLLLIVSAIGFAFSVILLATNFLNLTGFFLSLCLLIIAIIVQMTLGGDR